jgi:hypothetical protein
LAASFVSGLYCQSRCGILLMDLPLKLRRASKSRPSGTWETITGRIPQSTHDRGYAESREQAMADFKTAWLRKAVVVRT